MTPVPHAFDDDVQDAWRRYLAAWNNGTRSDAITRLNDLIDRLLADDESVGDEFARWLCVEYFDRHSFGWQRNGNWSLPRDIPLQFPMVERIVLPFLISGTLNERLPEARWLFQLRSHQWGARVNDKIRESDINVLQVIHDALRAGSNDPAAWRCLFSAYVADAEYALHEVRCGGRPLVSQGECQELIDDARAISNEAPCDLLTEKETAELDDLQELLNLWVSTQ